MVKREIHARYRGASIGMLWPFLQPLILLVIYTLVFASVLKFRWGNETRSIAEFAMILYAGLVMHGLFAESLNRAPALITGNVNLVKKVVFPLDLLPWVTLATAIFHALVGVLMLVLCYWFVTLRVNWTVMFLPLVLFPFALITVGVVFFVSAFSVFFRDMAQVTGLVSTAVLFLSPVLYPAESFPEALRTWLYLNPLTFAAEQSRRIVLWNQAPDWWGLVIYTAIAVVVACLGFMSFQRMRKGFADVL